MSPKLFRTIVIFGFYLFLVGVVVFVSFLSSSKKFPTFVVSKNGKTAENADKIRLVTRVIDGDTIEIEGGAHVRYIGMDTPEVVDPRKPVQCFGLEAQRRNKELVEGKRVFLEKDVSEVDKYSRLLRYVYVDNRFVNWILVNEGLARVATFPPDVKYQSRLLEAEWNARDNKRGLWTACPTHTSR